MRRARAARVAVRRGALDWTVVALFALLSGLSILIDAFVLLSVH